MKTYKLWVVVGSALVVVQLQCVLAWTIGGVNIGTIEETKALGAMVGTALGSTGPSAGTTSSVSSKASENLAKGSPDDLLSKMRSDRAAAAAELQKSVSAQKEKDEKARRDHELWEEKLCSALGNSVELMSEALKNEVNEYLSSKRVGIYIDGGLQSLGSEHNYAYKRGVVFAHFRDGKVVNVCR